jgi:hypothetical protein
MEFRHYEDDFHFLLTLEPESGPRPQTAANHIPNAKYPMLEDDDDEQVVQIDNEAGSIYQQDPPPRTANLK